MRRFKCTVAYVGAAYDGWQSQKLGLSVQEQIEGILRRVAHQKINITASGRTDAGVSARGQVFHFDSDRDLSARKWMGALNGYLPADIHITDIEETDFRFHARYCVRQKQYDYRINTGPYDVFTRDTAYQCPVKLDIGKMYEASRYLIGRHDFTSFNSSPLKEYPDQVRTIRDITFSQEGNILKISYTGKGFLRYMVRMMSAQLIEVGKGKLQPEDIRVLLEKADKSAAKRNAPANGLTLERVDYFEICALSEQGMIREFLIDDEIPEGWTLEGLEQSVQERSVPRIYAFTTRHSQRLLGIFSVFEEGGIRTQLQVYSEEGEQRAESLKEQMEKWIAEEGYSSAFEVKIIEQKS